jgi:hypothetical protein
MLAKKYSEVDIDVVMEGLDALNDGIGDALEEQMENEVNAQKPGSSSSSTQNKYTHLEDVTMVEPTNVSSPTTIVNADNQTVSRDLSR